MLGRGSKFIQAGINTPKPLILVKNKFLFEWSLKAINFFDLEKSGIFIILKEHEQHCELEKKIRQRVGKKTEIKIYDFVPHGAAKTVLLIRDEIDNENELIVYNSDQYFESELRVNWKKIVQNVSGMIPIFHATHPRWSFVETNQHNDVLRVAEKEPISNKATVGLYFFKKGSDFVWAADRMVEKKLMVNGEYYICPVYNELIQKGKKIKAFLVNKMWGLGTPEEVEHFEKYYKDENCYSYPSRA